MKKVFALLLAFTVLMTVFSGCGLLLELLEDDEEPESSQLRLETFGDIFKLDIENYVFASYENFVICGFSIGDDLYRAAASVSDETQQAIWDLDDISIESKELHEIIDGIAIGKLENLNDQKLTREQMDSLVGKTMSELTDDGWHSQGYDLSSMEFWMSYGPYIYKVFFSGEIPESEYEDFSEYSDMDDKTVLSVEYYMVGDPTDIDIDTFSID